MTGSRHADLWGRICHHLDGLAIGSTVCALHERGFFELLAGADRRRSVDRLARELDARRGYFHLAVKLLAAQGLVARSGDITAGETAVALTPSGRQWLDEVDAYRCVPRLLDLAAAMIAGDAGPLQPEVVFDEPDVRAAGTRVHRHLEGHIVAPAMTVLGRARLRDDSDRFDHELARHGAVLRQQGWADARGRLTAAGDAAVAAASQYFYPVSYLATTAAVPQLLFGAPPFVSGAATEEHVDRALDVAFSGVVFERQCRQPLLDVALPLFDAPLTRQPAAVVDTGCGDGTLLATLYRAVVDGTERGRHLDTHPLLVVGAEFNEVAREIAEQRLSRAGIPHLTLFGDIGDPAALAEQLRRHGIDPHDVLHVSKSVVHNRRYVPPRSPPSFAPASRAVFIDADGDLIGAADAEQSLVEHFRSWLPWCARHGMIVIEAHTVAPTLVAAALGRNVVTGLDASHGYSRQYLVEAEVHRRATRVAGFAARSAVDLGTAMTGRPLMTVDHLVAADDTPWLDRLLG